MEVFDLILVQTSQHGLTVAFFEITLVILTHLEIGSSDHVSCEQSLQLLFTHLVLNDGAEVMLPAIAAERYE
jgi:hypothetical protein